jgi:hypothetical protein
LLPISLPVGTSGIRVHGILLQSQGLSGGFMPVIPQDINITVEEVSKIGELLKPAELQ